MAPTALVARAPGRVNLIGEHTDYNGGPALPLAIDLAVEVRWRAVGGGGSLVLRSDAAPGPATVPPGMTADAVATFEPAWARYPAGVAAVLGPVRAGVGHVTSDLPVGAGLSSSAALCVATTLLLSRVRLGADLPTPDPLEVARTCQRAEALAGVEVGLMDPLVSAAGRPGHALLIDFSALTWRPVPVPEDAELVIVDSGERRALGDSPYAERRRACERVAEALGPLPGLDLSDLAALPSGPLRWRARHVVTECRRVVDAAAALARGDLVELGTLMDESHHSMAVDFEASTPGIDALVADLRRRPGVLGARLTGGGFGGCVVALCHPGALDPARWPGRAWRVRPSAGATVSVLD